MKLLVLLVIAGFGIGALSGGDFHSINFHNLSLDEVERFFDTVDLGPLNGLLNDMREAVRAIHDQVLKFIDMAQEQKGNISKP